MRLSPDDKRLLFCGRLILHDNLDAYFSEHVIRRWLTTRPTVMN